MMLSFPLFLRKSERPQPSTFKSDSPQSNQHAGVHLDQRSPGVDALLGTAIRHTFRVEEQPRIADSLTDHATKLKTEDEPKDSLQCQSASPAGGTSSEGVRQPEAAKKTFHQKPVTTEKQNVSDLSLAFRDASATSAVEPIAGSSLRSSGILRSPNHQDHASEMGTYLANTEMGLITGHSNTKNPSLDPTDGISQDAGQHTFGSKADTPISKASEPILQQWLQFNDLNGGTRRGVDTISISGNVTAMKTVSEVKNPLNVDLRGRRSCTMPMS
ncbi:hypothetical protein V8B97DRAFT_822057 [Scleroderma yunnanense]